MLQLPSTSFGTGKIICHSIWSSSGIKFTFSLRFLLLFVWSQLLIYISGTFVFRNRKRLGKSMGKDFVGFWNRQKYHSISRFVFFGMEKMLANPVAPGPNWQLSSFSWFFSSFCPSLPVHVYYDPRLRISFESQLVVALRNEQGIRCILQEYLWKCCLLSFFFLYHAMLEL